MQADDNPLLDFSGLPRFDVITPAHVAPAVDTLLSQARDTVEKVAADPAAPTWTTLVDPVADALDRLDRAGSVVRHMNAGVNPPALRDAYNAALPGVIAFYTDLGQDLRLYAKYEALRASPEYDALDAPRKRLVDNELRDFKLGGAELDDAGKLRYKAVQEEL